MTETAPSVIVAPLPRRGPLRAKPSQRRRSQSQVVLRKTDERADQASKLRRALLENNTSDFVHSDQVDENSTAVNYV